MRRTAAAILTAALVAPLAAQAPPVASSTLNQTKQMEAIAAQKTEVDIRNSLEEAARWSSIDRTKASARLTETIAQLEADKTLTDSRKSTLLRVVRDRLRVIELGPDLPEVIAKQRQTEESKRAAEKAEAAKADEDKKKVKEGLDNISKLRKEGKTAEADKLAAALANKHPESLALQLLTNKSTFAKAVAVGERERKQNEANIVNVFADVNKSSTPLNGDMTYPSDWNEKAGKRRDLAGPTLEEKALLRSLETQVDANFKNSRFQDVMDYLSTASGRTIILDPSAAAEASVTYETPVNFAARSRLSFKTTLRQILATYNLTFVIRDGIIHVTTPQKARDLMTVKRYPIGDLVIGVGLYGGAPNIGVQQDQIQTIQNLTALVEMITGAIDPMSWEKRGGQGHIGVHMPSQSLIVRQSQEVHLMLGSRKY